MPLKFLRDGKNRLYFSRLDRAFSSLRLADKTLCNCRKPTLATLVILTPATGILLALTIVEDATESYLTIVAAQAM